MPRSDYRKNCIQFVGQETARVVRVACVVALLFAVWWAGAGSSSALSQVRTPGTGGFDPQCVARPETGIWAVKRPRNKQLSRLEVQIDCRNGLYLARAFVRCGRTDCSWGYAQAVGEGNTMKMVFEGFSALYYVTARSAGAAGLNVLVETRFRDNAKPSVQALYALERAN